MAVEGRVRDQVLARLEHDVSVPLRGERPLDRREDRVRADPEPLDVVPREEADLDCRHAGDSVYSSPA